MLLEFVYPKRKVFAISWRALLVLILKASMMTRNMQMHTQWMTSKVVCFFIPAFSDLWFWPFSLCNFGGFLRFFSGAIVHWLKRTDFHFIGQGRSKWIKVNEKRTLYDVLREPNFIIPGIPGMLSFFNLQRVCYPCDLAYFVWFFFHIFPAVFYVVSAKSSFYKKFKAGKWAPPPWNN